MLDKNFFSLLSTKGAHHAISIALQGMWTVGLLKWLEKIVNLEECTSSISLNDLSEKYNLTTSDTYSLALLSAKMGLLSLNNDATISMSIQQKESVESLVELAQLKSDNAVLSKWLKLSDSIRQPDNAYYEKVRNEPRFAQAFYNDQLVESEDTYRQIGDVISTLSNDIADIGAGTCRIAEAILSNNQSAQVTALDFNTVNDINRKRLRGLREKKRIHFLDGDYTRSIPLGHKLYLLRNIIHNLNDNEAASLLKRIRNSNPSCRIAIVENVTSKTDTDLETAYLDVAMRALLGGKERSTSEIEDMLAEIDYKLIDFHDITSTHKVMVFAHES